MKGGAAKLHRSSGGKELYFALRNGAVVPASQMSDGIVLAVALALISLTSGNSRLLIEEPESGLHPRQLKVIADAIRSIANTHRGQVVLTTHSPLLLNHFAAEEVLLVTRDQAGVHVQRMSEARGLDELASEMALGELWYNVGEQQSGSACVNRRILILGEGATELRAPGDRWNRLWAGPAPVAVRGTTRRLALVRGARAVQVPPRSRSCRRRTSRAR